MPAATIVTVVPTIVHTPLVSEVRLTVNPVGVTRSVGSTDTPTGFKLNVPPGA